MNQCVPRLQNRDILNCIYRQICGFLLIPDQWFSLVGRISQRACKNRGLGLPSRVPDPIGPQPGQESAFLTHYQVMLIWWVQRPHSGTSVLEYGLFRGTGLKLSCREPKVKDISQLFPLKKTNQRKQVLGLSDQINGGFKALPMAVGGAKQKGFN